MRGYKIIDRDLTALGILYVLGETKQHTGELELGTSGLHFCPRAINCIRGDRDMLTGRRCFEVEARGPIIVRGGDACTDALHLLRELTQEEFRSMCTDVAHEYYPDSFAIKSEQPYVLGRREGRRTEWYEDGCLRAMSHWFADRVDGICASWYPTGTLESRTRWNDYRFHGTCFTWTEYGELLSLSKWQHGTLVTHRRYHPESKPARAVSPTLQIATLFPLPDSPRSDE